VNEILSFIFGNRDDEKVTKKTLRDWMDKRRLHAIQVGSSAFDVRIEDLEALRAAKNPDADSV
jgi:hypothetical protein